MTAAGRSARNEFERRQAVDSARRRSNRGVRAAVTIATPFFVYGIVGLAVPTAVDRLFEWMATRNGAEAPRPIDTEPWHLVGLLLAVVATVGVARQLWGRRQSTEAWGKGADGEVATGRILDALPGFGVRHDLPMPGSRANIDHVVAGPTGVFTIETKNYRGGVRVDRGRVTAGGRPRDGIADQARRQAEAIAARTGRVVRPIVVVHGGVQLSWFSSPIVDGVRFCGPRSLAKVLTTGDRALSEDQVAEVLVELDAPNRPPAPVSTMEADQCACGGEWVERRRRADGAAFLGCSRFPTCRQTRALTSD